MKRIVVFLLSFLLLVAVSISGAGNNAFAYHGSPPQAEVVNLVCQVLNPCPGEAPCVTVYALSTNFPTTTASISVGDDCGTDLTTLVNAGLKIKDVTSTNSFIIYTLVNKYCL